MSNSIKKIADILQTETTFKKQQNEENLAKTTSDAIKFTDLVLQKIASGPPYSTNDVEDLVLTKFLLSSTKKGEENIPGILETKALLKQEVDKTIQALENSVQYGDNLNEETIELQSNGSDWPQGFASWCTKLGSSAFLLLALLNYGPQLMTFLFNGVCDTELLANSVACS